MHEGNEDLKKIKVVENWGCPLGHEDRDFTNFIYVKDENSEKELQAAVDQLARQLVEEHFAGKVRNTCTACGAERNLRLWTEEASHKVDYKQFP